MRVSYDKQTSSVPIIPGQELVSDPRLQASTATASAADRNPQAESPVGWEMLIELIERFPTTDDRWFADE